MAGLAGFGKMLRLFWQSENVDAENTGPEAITKSWEGDFPILSAAWAPTTDNSCLFSLASFYEQSENFIRVVQQKGKGEFSEICEPVDHEYPVTDSTWHGGGIGGLKLICGGQKGITFYGLREISKTNSKKQNRPYSHEWTQEYSHELTQEYAIDQDFDGKLPVTGLDCCTKNQNRLFTTCASQLLSIFDVNVGKRTSSFRLGDMEGMANITIKSAPTNSEYSCAVGRQDGSMRLFKAGEKNQVVEILKKQGNPVVRLSWSEHNSNLLAALHLHAHKPIVIDVRNPSSPLDWKEGVYGSHDGFMSDIAWSNSKRNSLCTAWTDKDVHAKNWIGKILTWECDKKGNFSSDVPLEHPWDDEPCSRIMFNPNKGGDMAVVTNGSLHVFHQP